MSAPRRTRAKDQGEHVYVRYDGSIPMTSTKPIQAFKAAKAAYEADPTPANRQALERAAVAWNRAGQPRS